MTVESLEIVRRMVDEGLTVEEIANHFDYSESETLLINQYINWRKANKKENKKENKE